MGDIPIAPLGDGAPEPGGKRSRRGRIVAIAVVVVVVVVAVAIGVSQSGSSHTAKKAVTVADVVGGTRGTVRVHISTQARGTRPTEVLVATRGDGVIDFDNHRVEINFAVPDFSSGIKPPAALKTTSTELYSDGHLYLGGATVAALGPELPKGRHVKWVEFDIPQGLLPGDSAAQAFDVDPTHVFALLQARGAKLGRIGTDTVAGVRATHYRGTLIETKPSPGRLAISGNKLAPSTSAAPIRVTLNFDLWTDSARRLVKIASTSSSGPHTIETFTDYGGPAHIPAPRANEVYSIDPLTQSSSPTTAYYQPPTKPALPPSKLDGSWTLVNSGPSPVAWKIWEGTAGSGAWQCFTSEPAALTDRNVLASAPVVGGKHAWCDPRPSTFDSDVRLFDAPLGTPTVFMGLAENGAHALTLHFADGAAVPVRVQSHGLFGTFRPGTLLSLTWVDQENKQYTCAQTGLGESVGNVHPGAAPTKELPVWPCTVGAFTGDVFPAPTTTVP